MIQTKFGKLAWYAYAIALLVFYSITKWRYVIIVDGTDEFLYGFPFTYTCTAFHTSLARQYFLREWGLNLGSYFSISLLVLWVIDSQFAIPAFKKWVKKALGILTLVLIVGQIQMSWMLDDMYHLYRSFGYEQIDSGYRFSYQWDPPREDYQYIWEDFKNDDSQ